MPHDNLTKIVHYRSIIVKLVENCIQYAIKARKRQHFSLTNMPQLNNTNNMAAIFAGEQSKPRFEAIRQRTRLYLRAVSFPGNEIRRK